MIMKVSFDVDDTLTHPSVFKYTKQLVESGIEVWIVTTRYDERSKQLNPNYFAVHGETSWK